MESLEALIPNIEIMTRIYSLTMAPTFLLFANMGLCLIYSNRLAGQAAILRSLACDPMAEVSFLSDRIDIAERRCQVLSRGVKFSCYAAFGAVLLILILVVAGVTSARHAYAVPVVSFGVLAFLLLSFVQFARDVNLEMAEVGLYRLSPAELSASSDKRLKSQYAYYSTGAL